MIKTEPIPGVATGPEITCKVNGFKIRQEIPRGADPLKAASNILTKHYNNEPREVEHVSMILQKMGQDNESNCLERAEL